MRRLSLMLASAVLLVSNLHAAPLKLCYEDVPQVPWTFPDGTGLNIELLKRVEKLTGDSFVYVARPWKRCNEEVRAGLLDGLIGAVDSPTRRQFTLPPLLPDGTPNPEKAIYEDQVYVFVRAGSNAAWDGHTLVNPRGAVIALAGYYVTGMLRNQGLAVKDQVKSPEDALRMLVAGSADVAVLQGLHPVDMAHTDTRFRGKVDVADLPFATFSLHLLINRTTYLADPRRIDAIWNAIRDVRANAEYKALEAQETRRRPRNH